ncbi:MAG: hypothetical protein ACRD5Z_23240, partial [Bryobacteraceae bacterium]
MRAPLVLLPLATASLLCYSPRHDAAPAQGQRHKQELFQRLFGGKIVSFDPSAVAKVKTLR